jgi:hypothetical protein
MWFDRLDPRDPLQLTEGVWGLLTRAYLPGNVTLWGWVLRGEEGLKGWELLPTLEGTAEAGARVQLPLGPGELGLTYHHRRFDPEATGLFPNGLGSPSGNEDRFAVDGKWDLEVGVWLEAVFTRQDADVLARGWSRAWNIGLDYTFDVGNGLTILTEHLVKQNPSFRGTQLAGTLSDTDPGVPATPSQGPIPEIRLTSFTANYPVGVLDRVSAAVYRDWEGSGWFRLLEWRRTYDRWRIHLLGFWNPGEGSIFPSSDSDNVTRTGSLGGRGAQVIVVFNH